MLLIRDSVHMVLFGLLNIVLRRRNVVRVRRCHPLELCRSRL